MIKKFEEFVNEGLISDYKKQEEAANKEVSNGDKTFVLEVLKKISEVGMPYIFTCKNCAILGSNVNKDEVDVDRNKIINFDDIKDDRFKEIHITERSVLQVLDEDNDYLEDGVEYKNIWSNIYKWFDKTYEKMELEFSGKVKVAKLLELKNDIKKDLF